MIQLDDLSVGASISASVIANNDFSIEFISEEKERKKNRWLHNILLIAEVSPPPSSSKICREEL